MAVTPNGQESVDEGKQPVAVPTTEKPVEVSAPPKDEARTATPEGQKPTQELPEEASERTRKEFEKLKEHNRLMAEELKALKNPPAQRRSALDIFQPTQASPQQQPPVFAPPFATRPPVQEEPLKPIEPDENGYIDINALNQTVQRVNDLTRQAQEEARRAREEARRAEERVSKFEHTDKTLKTYEKFPYLDPNRPEFDEKFSDLVRKELLDQMVNQGRENYIEAAERVKRDYYDPSSKPEPKVDPKVEENVAKRDQINAMPRASKGESEPEQEFLVQETRRGNRSAIYQRLKKSGF